MEITMPCGGQEIKIRIPDKNVLSFLEPTVAPGIKDVNSAIRKALENPIGSKRLSEIAKPSSKVALLLDSWKRPTRHWMFLPAVVDELKKAGVRDENIKMISANGMHRNSTKEEREKKVGKEWLERFKYVEHNRSSQVKFVGITRRAANPVWINADVIEADVKIAIGNIGFNILPGYSGGAKMICPGLASVDTINYNHRLDLSSETRSGSIDPNPCRIDLEEMGYLAGLDFIVNAIHSRDGEVVAVVAGHFIDAHRAGAKICASIYMKEVPGKADILVASANPRYTIGGAPIDDLPWAAMMTEKVVRPGGTMIFSHLSPDPKHPIVHTNCPYADDCESLFLACRPDPEQVLIDICRCKIPGWFSLVYAVSRIMTEKDIVVVNPHFNKRILAGSGWKWAPSMQEAIDSALAKYGPDAKVIVAPYGGRMTFPKIKGEE